MNYPTDADKLRRLIAAVKFAYPQFADVLDSLGGDGFPEDYEARDALYDALVFCGEVP